MKKNFFFLFILVSVIFSVTLWAGMTHTITTKPNADWWTGATKTQKDTALLWAREIEQFIEDTKTFVVFNTNPVTAKVAGGAATGATGDENVFAENGDNFEYHILGAGQTILAPSMISTGIDISLDQTADEGLEIGQGITAGAKHAFTVGTDTFYMKVKFDIPDVSGTDDCAVGFRKAEAYQGAIDNYDEMAALNVISGDIKIETILNNAATTTTDTTDNWADGETKTLEIYVSSSGVVTYKIDGSAPTTTAAFTFDDGEVVVPFFYFLHDTDLAQNTALIEWDVGLQQ